ncbi:hypothetical protein A0U91_15050 (plasmid) [Acetobacter persici]|uniref:Transglycosylase SLT domain-containing protein n=2 Tax=Acetobacter persici TaxID=1076596 RepID=A0A1U9LIS2_9PROT|nr:hypothetical protein A0U91_15050 [Acetobacter persici]
MSCPPPPFIKTRPFGAFVGIVFALAPALAEGRTIEGGQCVAATQQVERELHIPDGFLSAMSRVEAGKQEADGSIVPWPWTVNAAGVGHHYASKQEAVAAVEEFQKEGIRSIDIGCMQVNIMHHPDAFSDLNAAFDPYTNSAYAGRFLTQLFDKMGSWPRAAAAYHSQTPGVGEPYQWKVLEAWAIPQDERGARPNRQLPPAHPAPLPAPVVAASQNIAPTVSSFRPFRPFTGASRGLSSTPRQADKFSSGRTLASYRANPTHMVSMTPRPQIY